MKLYKKKSSSNRRNTLWFNNDCKIAIRIRNAALRKLKKRTLNKQSLLRYSEQRQGKPLKKLKRSVGKIM